MAATSETIAVAQPGVAVKVLQLGPGGEQLLQLPPQQRVAQIWVGSDEKALADLQPGDLCANAEGMTVKRDRVVSEATVARMIKKAMEEMAEKHAADKAAAAEAAAAEKAAAAEAAAAKKAAAGEFIVWMMTHMRHATSLLSELAWTASKDQALMQSLRQERDEAVLTVNLQQESVERMLQALEISLARARAGHQD